jgi:hypothetical protein
MRIRVDLPDPLGPTSPITPAAGTSILSRSTAVMAPNRRVRPVVVTTLAMKANLLDGADVM